MKLRALILFCLMPLSGCGISGLINSLNSTPNLTGNWQIQSGSTSSGEPAAGLLLLGQLTSSGSNVTGTFRLADLTVPNSCGVPLRQVVTVSGSVDSNRNLTLTSAAFSGSVLTIQLTIPPIVTSFGSGTIAITGGSCTFASASAVAAEVASVTGTYSGAISANATFSNSPITAGTATLTISQSGTPTSDGQFSVSGTLGFVGGGCTSSTAVSGTVSGSELNLSNGTTLPLDQVIGFAIPTGTELDEVNVTYGYGPCGTTLTTLGNYTGTLTRQ